MKWISAAEITQWTDKNARQAQEKMPELIRRLIQATAPSLKRIDFPCDNSVTTGGWDGHLETLAQQPFFPDGISKWEIGTEKNTNKKADDDYSKRKQKNLGAIPAETTYVAVTSRAWIKRNEWERAKKAEGYWKEVRAIGADELELWLASAPAVALWFARLIGKATTGIRSLEAMWYEWSISTNPAFTPDIIIAGRKKERDEVQKWLSAPAGIFEMQGDSSDEPFAFLYASISTLPQEQQEVAFARAIRIENLQQLRDCCDSFQSPLIIAAPAECLEGANAAVAKGHHVFLSMDAKTIKMGRILTLTRPQREALQKALQNTGMTEADAQRHMRESGRSMPVLRRRLFRSSLVKTPIWAEPAIAAILLPALLAGSWIDNLQGDQEMIETLCGTDYKTFIKQLTPIMSAEDTPVRKVGDVWMLKSPLDLWFLIAHNLDSEHFVRFRKALNAVLTETDPKYDLSPDKRWAAGFYGKKSRCSESIRRGLVESLVLLAVYGERISGTIEDPQGFADKAVRDIFDGANTWQAWASLKDVTALLSEAAPQAFLDAVENKIDNNPSLFKDLLRDDDGTFGFGDCYHSGLLWALEGIAWKSEYITQASRVLYLLAKLDPGGRWSNRPLASLIDVLLPGIPQTHATPEKRLDVYDMIIKSDPTVAWKIAGSHMGSGSMSPSHRFRWRDDDGTRTGLDMEDRGDYTKYINALIPKWSGLVGATNENLASAVEDFLRLPDPVREQVLKILKDAKRLSLNKVDQKILLKNLRRTLNWVNNYDKEGKYKSSLPILTKAYNALIPNDTIDRVDWLFSNGWPQLPDAGKEVENHEKRLSEVRKKAARDLLDNLTLSAIFDYGETLTYPAIFTHAIATAVTNKKEDSEIVDALVSRGLKGKWLLVGYSMGRTEMGDEKWVPKQITRIKNKKNYSPEAAAALLRGMSEKGKTWDIVARYGQDVERAYWKIASGYSQSTELDKLQDSIISVEKLLSVGRPLVALHIAGDPHTSLPSDLLKKLLIDLINLKNEDRQNFDATMFEFYLTNVFNRLYENKELSLDEIGKLEWPFAQVFDRFNRRNNTPMALHRILQKDPAFFVQLMSYLYRKDDGESSKPEGMTDGQAESVAKNAREVLDSWNLVPGIKDDGSVDEETLNNWLDEARKLAEAAGYLKGCDLKLAEVLSRIPPDNDGMWPHIALRNTLERLRAPLIEKHIPYAIYNSRGVRSRGIFEGGEKEREMANTYKKWSEAMQVKWPRTSKVLKFLADMLDSDAKREDIDSELRDLEF